MFEEQFNTEQLCELRNILGNGEFGACRRAVRKRICRIGCCQNGALLLPGEVRLISGEQALNNFPQEVFIAGNELKNCFGENGCLMGDSKPILCRVYPRFFAAWGQYSWQVLNHPDENCPVWQKTGRKFEKRLVSAQPLFGRILVNE